MVKKVYNTYLNEASLRVSWRARDLAACKESVVESDVGYTTDGPGLGPANS